MHSDFKQISDIINDSAFEKMRKVVSENEVVEEFYEIFPEFKKIAKPKKVGNGILFLRVENSVWRSELNLQKAIIIKKVNKHFNKTVIKNIKFI
jgi:hypothetical protein